MPSTHTPLRYPGGKSQLTDFVAHLISINEIENPIYVEPFSGGAGIPIKLLNQGTVDSIILNDYDPSIHAIWYAILNYPKDLIKMLDEEEITIENWKCISREREKVKNDPFSILNALYTLFMNRTNRNGIINAGPIGGLEQDGKYKLNCRFNKKTLKDKIEKIAANTDKIQLFNMDAVEFINKVLSKQSEKSIFCFYDPPYFKQGKNLYTNYYDLESHAELSKVIKDNSYFHWIVTYDYEQAISHLYKNMKTFEYQITYTANKKRKARELLFANINTKISSYGKVELIQRRS